MHQVRRDRPYSWARSPCRTGTNRAHGIYRLSSDYLTLESAATDAQWIMVDLASAMPVDRVILKWHSHYAKAFKIQVSSDSTTWNDVYGTTIGASYSVTDVTFAKTTARYVRMNGTQRGSANGYSLFTFMVLNDP